MAEKKSMADVWKALEKQYGDEGMFVASSNESGYSKTISTGSYALDDALGDGLPLGCLTHLAGVQSSGKSLMSLSIIKEWQKKDPQNWAIYIDAEHSFEKLWAQKLSVDLDRLLIIKESCGVKIFERLVGQPGKTPGKKSKLGVLDLEIESGGTGLGIIVLDSIVAITVPQEEESVVGKQNMALLPRFLNPELRRITPLLAETGVGFVVINQVRDVIGGNPYGPSTDSSGGRALKHSSNASIEFSRINSAESKIERGGEIVGHMVRAKVVKNKKNLPGKVAEFSIEYLRGVVKKNEELRELGCKYGVIQRPNNRTYIYAGVNYNGKDDIANALVDENIQKKIWEEIKEAKKTFMDNISSGIEAEETVDDQESEKNNSSEG
jgi:recombination protein RecA